MDLASPASSGSDLAATLAAIAAFIAAGFSLTGVLVNAWLVSRRKRAEWRRNQVQPIVARLLTLSLEAVDEWQDAYSCFGRVSATTDNAKRDAVKHLAEAHLKTGSDLCEKMRFEAARLDLLAGEDLRVAAWGVLFAHLTLSAEMAVLSDGANAVTESGANVYKQVQKVQERLLYAARVDIKVDGRIRYRLEMERADRLSSDREDG
jgi:hypothetical protein